MSPKKITGKTGAILLVAVCSLVLGPTAGDASARVISVKENASFLPEGNIGVKVVEQGSGSGTFNGSVSSHLTINGSSISGTFTFKSRSGTISGRTSANVVGQAARPIVSFAGSLSVTSGSGAYARSAGRLSVSGTIRRRNYALTEVVSGKMQL
jgi:hypothetical protein